MVGREPLGIHMEYQLLRLELLERLGRHLERARSGGLSADEVDDLRRILLRRDALVRRFDVGRLESFGRKVFRNQCEARRIRGLPLPHSGPRELMPGRPLP